MIIIIKQPTTQTNKQTAWCIPCSCISDLKGRDDFIPLLVNGDRVAGIPLGIDDSVPPLPADDDGLFSARRTVQLFCLAFPRHGGVRVTGDHGRN